MVYYPSYRVKKRFGNFNKKFCLNKMKEFGKTILTIGEEYNLMFSIGGTISTITYNQQVPLNSSVIYDGQLIGNVLSHSDFSLTK